MKLKLSLLLLSAVMAVLSAPSFGTVVLNNLVPDVDYDAYTYEVSDSHLILQGNWLAGGAKKEMSYWGEMEYLPAVLTWQGESGENVMDGSGTITFCKGDYFTGTLAISGRSGAQSVFSIGSGITLKESVVHLNQADVTFNNTIAGYVAFEIWNDSIVRFGDRFTVAGHMDIGLSGGTLIAEKPIVLNSNTCFSCVMTEVGMSTVIGQLKLSGAEINCYQYGNDPLFVLQGNMSVSGSNALYFELGELATEIEDMEIGTVFTPKLPEPGSVLFRVESVTGSLSSIKMKLPKYKVIEVGDEEYSFKSYDDVGYLTLTDYKLMAVKNADGMFDIVFVDKNTPVKEYLPDRISGAASYKLQGTCELEKDLVVDSNFAVSILGSAKNTATLYGAGGVEKSGSGTLTMAAYNAYQGNTVLKEGVLKATGDSSFGCGDIFVKGGTLDLASKAVANDIVLSGAATLKGDAKYVGEVTVEGNATLLAKTSYKGTTTIGEDSSLTLGATATMAGDISLEGGTLVIRNTKGLTLAKNQTMTLDGGEVRGLVTVGAGGTLAWQQGTMQNAPSLKGGTLDLGGTKALTLTGSKAQVAFGDKVIDLPGKGIVRSDEMLDVLSGTVKLTAGVENAAIKVSGNAALVNGATHSGDITVSGTLAKGTTIKLIDSKQTVTMKGAGTTAAAISGVGTVNVNLAATASIDATAAKLTAANINLNSGTFINTKGIKLAKGQTLTLAGASVNLGAKGILTTAAGSTLKISESTKLSGSLTLGGGELVFEGAPLTVKGTLTLSKPVTVIGSGTLICDSVKPFKGDLGTLFGGADVQLNGTTLTINGGAKKQRLVAAPVAEEEAPLDAAPALPTSPAMPATNPVADAIAQADWGILDANRAFTGAVNTRHQHGALLDKGRGAAWVSAFGASVRHGNQGMHHGSDGNIEGAALGMEHSVSETGILGLAVGRSKNRIGATGVTHLRQETAHVALYGQKQFKHNLTADATAAWGDTETKLGGSAWQQKSAAFSGRLTHAHMVNDATAVRTFGGFSYVATESGSFGAAERSGSVQNLRAEVGAGATHTAGKAHVYGEASLTGDLIRHNPGVELGGIRHHGASPGRLGVKATMGAFYSFTDTWTGTASYSVEAESRTTAHTLNLGVSKSF